MALVTAQFRRNALEPPSPILLICMVGMGHVEMRPSQIWRETNWRKEEPFWFPWQFREFVDSVCRGT